MKRDTPIPHLRWWICGLLFFATTINYLDRQTMSQLRTTIEKDLFWTEADYGWINFSFQLAYAMFFTLAGRIIDRVGVRIALAAALVVWSLMAGVHAIMTTVLGFCIARFLLGAAESFNFPAAIKTVAQWHPQNERALSTGIFNSGSNIGIVLAAGVGWIVANTTLPHAWRIAFIVICLIGLLWLIAWLKLYNDPEKHPRLSRAELDFIKAGQARTEERLRLHWTTLLRYRQVWAFLIGKFMTDPVWWFYLYWLPSYLERQRGLSLSKSAAFIIIPYLAADVGSITGGWLSGFFINRGWRVGPARYMAMLLCAVCMPGAIIAVSTGNFWLAIILISLAASGHQGWSANLFTTATDLFPSKIAGSVVGLGGMTGAVGGMLMTLLVGLTLQWLEGKPNQYVPVFIWAGLMHPVCLVIFRVIAGPDLKTVDIDRPLDVTRPSRPLLMFGGVITLLGTCSALWLGMNWGYVLNATRRPGGGGITAAAGGMTAALIFVLIGMVVIYAGLGKKNARSTRI
jgi:MFS transporter, ACS family, hexuronate transporter